MTVADVLTEEQLRREEEEARFDREVQAIRDAVAGTFVVGGTTECIVLRRDVHAVVAEALDVRIVTPKLASFINEVVEGLGARPVMIGGQKCFGAVRRHDVELAVARKASTEMRRRFTRRGAGGARGARGAHGAVGSRDTTGFPTADTATIRADIKKEWEDRLRGEDLAPVALIPRPRRATRAGKKFEGDYVRDADFDGGGLTTTGSGGRRQRRTSMAEIYMAANDNAVDLLAEVEEERQVLKLRAEGLSLRKTAVAMGIDKMAVSRILKRIERRRDNGT